MTCGSWSSPLFSPVELHLKLLQEELGGAAGRGSVQTSNSRFLEKT